MRRPTANRNLLLSTVAFAISFALWGLISGLAPIFKSQYQLTATQASFAVAIPVLLGSVGRLPVGLLTDRYGGRLVFSILLMFGLIPALALAANHSYNALLFWGFFLGLMGTSFAVGVGFTSPWFSADRQGTALGIFGIGNIGQSVAVFSGPFLANSIGVANTFAAFGVVSLVWGVVFALFARNVPRAQPPRSLGDSLRVLLQPMAQLLSLLYFLTFGGFVALGVFLPTLLKDAFQLEPGDAGARAAGFVVVATLARPVGGWLADRIGGQVLLRYVFGAIVVFALLLIATDMLWFTAGALGCALCLGLGNGGVFKLVPRFFPKQTGTVTGLVGAAGGLGGFFPPITLGLLRDGTGSYAPGFALLAAFAAICLIAILAAAEFRKGARAPEAAGE